MGVTNDKKNDHRQSGQHNEEATMDRKHHSRWDYPDSREAGTSGGVVGWCHEWWNGRRSIRCCESLLSWMHSVSKYLENPIMKIELAFRTIYIFSLSWILSEKYSRVFIFRAFCSICATFSIMPCCWKFSRPSGNHPSPLSLQQQHCKLLLLPGLLLLCQLSAKHVDNDTRAESQA